MKYFAPLVLWLALAFPASAGPITPPSLTGASYDPTHPAAQGIVRYASLNSNGVPYNLLQWSSSVANAVGLNFTGTATLIIDPIIGGSMLSNPQRTQDNVSTVLDTAYTTAFIFTCTNLATNDLFPLAGGGTSVGFRIQGAQVLFRIGTSLIAFATTISNNTPYFIAASGLAGGNVNYVVVNLKTGKQLTATTTAAAATAVAPTNAWAILGAGNGAAATSIRAVMYSTAFLSVQQLKQWGADPYAFWQSKNFAYPTLNLQ